MNTNANGQASFTDLAITLPIGDRRLGFAAAGLTTAISNTVTVGAELASPVLDFSAVAEIGSVLGESDPGHDPPVNRLAGPTPWIATSQVAAGTSLAGTR